MAGEDSDPPGELPGRDEPDDSVTSGKKTENKGYFAKGNKLRPQVPNNFGSRHRFLRLIDDLTKESSRAVVQKLVDQAKAGDATAIRTFHEWYIPKPRAARINLDLPYSFQKPTSAEEANAALAQLAVDIGAGVIDVETANAIANAIKLYLISLGAGFEMRLYAIEGQLRGAKE